ncbi:histone deacetylase family protein [Loktanella sp. SALINAS62]|uniref:histone deacetylase family protein n=1 Tax=Loktanella sp. SALINAS62 TaxID=2706124 RepID=UPI001B8C2C47|nr:histone deacetylase family protein [Loktanella sp. SALINAS62]MBS1301814.1 histone deacetylase family protein [Loktanella sp. SALINAS62]
MKTVLITHPDCLEHVTPPGHPEQVARMDAVAHALDGMDLHRILAPMAAEDDVLRVHPRSHLDALRRAAPATGVVSLDADTHMSPGTLAAVCRGAGGAVRAVDLVMDGTARNVFVAMRPPGHHAEKTTAMGFCFFGNVAIAAKHALDHHGLSRVAIVDFDVHHGNGTQDLVEDDPRILFCSTHQMPLYPGTGHADETGVADNVVNVPLAEGTDGTGFRHAMNTHVLPRVRAFKPDMIVISAGFDAHAHDPLAGLALVADDFGWITGALCDLADDLCDGRVVSCLEGGYDLTALGACVAAHVKVLRERCDG